VVPNLEFEECPDCGERLFDHAAMQKIEAYSPAYKHRASRVAKRIEGRAAEKKTAAAR
jgi:hypothetical protein